MNTQIISADPVVAGFSSVADILKTRGLVVTVMNADQIALTDKRPGLVARYWFERGQLVVGVLFCDPNIYGGNILSIYRSNDRGRSWHNLAMFPSPERAAHILCEQFNIDPREQVRLVHA